MIIGFDASRAFADKKTGTENYSYQLLLHLSKIDHKNHYKVFLRPEKGVAGAGKARQDPEILWPDNFEFITIPYPRLWTQAGLAKQTFKESLDILFIPSHTLPLIRKPGLKTVVAVHDLGAEYLPQTHQLKQKLYLNFMTHHQLKSATHLIAVSKATKEDLIKKAKINPDKITVIYEGYDKTAFKPQKTDELNNILKYYDLESNNYFLFVGTIQPRKNLERLIRAYAKFLERQDPEQAETKPKLILAGSKGWLADEIYELPKKLGIEHLVKFLGYVPDKNLPALYNGAIALLFPSLFEGFGLPVLEAMACKCPVLTSNVSSLPEVAGNSALLINPNLDEEIAQGINKLFFDQTLRNKLKKLGIAQARKFSWEKCAKKTLETLFQVYSK